MHFVHTNFLRTTFVERDNINHVAAQGKTVSYVDIARLVRSNHLQGVAVQIVHKKVCSPTYQR